MNGTPFLSRNVSPSPVARHPVSLTPTTFFCSSFFSSAPAALNQPITPATANPNTMCERVIATSGTAPECRDLSYHCRGPLGPRIKYSSRSLTLMVYPPPPATPAALRPSLPSRGSFRWAEAVRRFPCEAVPRARLRPPAFVELDEELLGGAG